MSPTCFQLAFTAISFKTFLRAIESRFSIPGSRHQMYKTYTTGQLRIKTVFQNNIQFQDSSRAFLFIFSRVSSRVQSSIRGGKKTYKIHVTLSVQFLTSSANCSISLILFQIRFILRANPPPPFSMLYRKEANSRDRKSNIEKGGGVVL